MAFGRMNPPTIGHAKLVDAIKSQPGDPFIFLSQTQKPKTDPLSFNDKLRYAKFFFPEVTIGNPEVKTIIQALQKIESLGYQQLIYVAGSDRISSFEELINKYNGKDYNFKSIKVVSAGQRDADAEGAEGMSASKLKKLAAEGKLEDWTDETGKKQPGFRSGVPEPKLADEMFAAVRKGMGVMDAVPAEGVQEENNILDPLRGAAAELFGKQPKEEAPEKIALDQAMEKYKNNPKGLKAWLMKNRNILVWLNTSGGQMMDIVKQRIRETTTAGGIASSMGSGNDFDDITLQRLLKFGAQIDMDKQKNPGEFIRVSDETKAAIAKARAQAKRNRVTNVPSRAHDKDGVHKQGFKPVKFPKSNSISNFKLADD
jgi:hypothetical protein